MDRWLGRRARWAATLAVLAAGALWQIAAPNGDLRQYRCFALAFWQGSGPARAVAGCAARLPAGSFAPFHVLPREYPPLALVPDSLPLLFGGAHSLTLYTLAFNVLLLLCLAATAWLLRDLRPDAEGWYLLWLAIGATTIALERLDALPALLVVLALRAARRGPSWAAYLWLAAATMLKLYPALLILALAADDWQRRVADRQAVWDRATPNPASNPNATGMMLAGLRPTRMLPDRFVGAGIHQRSRGGWESMAPDPPLRPMPPDQESSREKGWSGDCGAGSSTTTWDRRWRWLLGPALAAGVMATIQAAADALAGQPGVPWLSVQGARPPQIESTAAALQWLTAAIAGQTLTALSVEHALALTDPLHLGHPLAMLTMALAGSGIALGAWGIAAGRLSLTRGATGMLLALLAGANIFSPQYLLWAAPLVALAGAERSPTGGRRDMLRAVWGGVCLATTAIYSVGYLENWPGHPGVPFTGFMLLVCLRDALVWAAAAWLLAPAVRWRLAHSVLRTVQSQREQLAPSDTPRLERRGLV